ncbi:tRNA glutamyl-Q(34) synthetase GluQRS [Mesoterricola silvestris]|uniref:Glutamyl-Q tRNA(Asp) synthetase n=1 Tax=Mesoterricola silvestris TaxID=2927979 RepID=A0AA48GWH0_9BACT|nr:tRNA glutamyl-Q(34) synthetase GluQRS [Mesoterricola silvestris]BDU71608.1 glutamyl-Q tRNA(Asp) synthetase [Mesoterricola silvestris]
MECIGRFAPSPTGELHLGNLRTALASWLSARAGGGRWVIRMEDVDTARCRSTLGEAQLRDLAALGLESDGPVLWQSRRAGAYQAALQRLFGAGLLYPCACTRKDLAAMASAPHLDEGLRPYPGTCRHRALPFLRPDALRFRVPDGAVDWEDLLRGPQRDDPAALTGDPLLHRRDGCYAYHLAVVVDDAAQGVTEVVRGLDLRGVTATQARLQEALGLPRPAYAHLGLVTAPGGSRLGKRDGALGLALLAHRGVDPARVLGWLGWSLGCLERPEPARLEELLPGFSWSRVPAGPVEAPADWI